ncbi:MAG: hypothetical protein GXP31_06975 [Kiritimatiellaeota bacterium]|nr:hypothetical protein [Kiritimatiellota bacterium]
MQVSVFEVIMVLCFGLAWPFSIVKSYRSRNNAGKSLLFLYTVFVGYVSGVVHKFLYALDAATALYALNGMMVFIDICLYYRNARIARQAVGAESAVV